MVKKYANLKIIGLILAVLMLMVLIVFLVGRSFGFFQYMKKGEVINVVTINGLSVNIDNTTDQALNLEDAYPMYDSEGLENDPFTFTMTNTSSKPIDYTLRLLNDEDKQEDCVLEDEVTPCTLLPYQYIKYAYSINNGSYSTPVNLTSTGEIYSETIQGNGATTISIKLWIDSTAPNSIQGNAFFGKLVITGEKSLFNSSLPTSVTKGDSYQIAREALSEETISCTSDKDGNVTNTSTLTTIGMHTITCTSTKSSGTSSSTKKINITYTPYTVTNLVGDSSFENDGEGWAIINDKAEISSTYSSTGTKSLYLNDQSDSSGIWNYYSVSISENHKVYIGAKMMKISGSYASVSIWQSSSTTFGFHMNPTVNNVFQSFSKVVNVTVDSGRFQVGISSAVITTAYIDDVFAYDLTEIFGAGNEPSKEWCDKHIGYFDGTQTIYK